MNGGARRKQKEYVEMERTSVLIHHYTVKVVCSRGEFSVEIIDVPLKNAQTVYTVKPEGVKSIVVIELALLFFFYQGQRVRQR